MWGCLKGILWLFGIATALLFFVIGGGWWLLGSPNFAEYVRKRIETTLENRLGRDVAIRSVTFVRTRPQKIILNDLRIANAPGGKAPAFALVQQVEITGGIQSFWARNVKVDRVDIRGARMWFEILPDGTHNFPKWKTEKRRRRFEIVRLDIGKLYITGGVFSFFDRKHDIEAVAQKIDSTVTVTRAEGLYEGIMTSPAVRVRIQEYEPFDLDLRGGFRYTPGVLALRSIALKGTGIEAFVSGKLDPLTDGVYDLGITSRIELARIRQIFRVEKTLDGQLALDTRLRGKQGSFRLTGGWISPQIVADAYELADAKGTLDVTGNNLGLKVERATYGGGRIGADYLLSQYAEPYPMKVDLRYDGISIEKLFSDWGIENTGLRAAATGELTYRWNKDKVLDGAGEGTAKLAKNAVAFSSARYPVGIAGTTDFTLDRGVVHFRSAELDTDKSHVSLTGSLKIEGVVLDMKAAVRSTDFSELDRIAFNFAQSADKKDYELLGLGGAGTIDATVKGPIDKPQLVATVIGTGVRYNEVLLGDADLALRYNGDTATLTFDRGIFVDAGGRLALTGNIEFPESGGPVFDIAVEANGYPAQRAIDAVGLDLQIGPGLATGKMVVAGTPENGRATFANLVVRRADATLALNGTINWLPGEGNTVFDLDIAANNFPVVDIAAFLDFADVPATGKLTGTLKIAGRKEALEGSGRVTVREGVVFGEPVDVASADLVFSEGRMRATNVVVQSPAGEIRGEAELDLANERFSYTITSSNIDLSRLQVLAALKDLLGGNIILTSTGAGTFTNPELMVQATLNNATLRGLQLPEGSDPPSLYIAIRGGRLIVRGGIADIVSIEGEGSVGEQMAVDGLVRVVVHDIARALSISAATASIPAAGNLVVDLKLGGRLTPMEALIVEGTVPVLNLTIGGHPFTTPEPLRVALRNGRVELDSVVLRSEDANFTASGFAELTGAKRIDLDLRGRMQSALLQLFVPDMRAEGHTDLEMSMTGTMADPTITGTATLVDAQVKFAGFPQLIDEINGTLRFRGDRIEIESVRATVGGGRIIAGGAIYLDGLAPSRVRVTLQGTDVAIRYYEGVTVEGNFQLLLTSDLDRAMLQGDVDVTRALYFRDFDIQQMLLNVLLARDRVVPTTAATWQERLGLGIHLSAPGTLAVRNNIAEVTGSAEIDVTGTVAAPVVLGEITLDEGGTVRFQNVDYSVVRGTISFQNPFRIDPFFDVTVEGTVAGNVSEIETGPLDLTINLTGTLDRLTPSITSDPPASDITLFSLLGFGGLGAGSTLGGTAGAGVFGTSLLYQSLFTALGSRVFPFVDSFAYDPGDLESGGGSGAKVTFEKRLSNKLRFLLVYNLDNQQSRQVLEWQVNPSWTLQLARDESDEYRLDARFRRRYEAHWEWGRGREEDFAEAATMGTAAAAPPVAPVPPVTSVNVNAADGAVVSQINFRADARFDTTMLEDDVTLAPGQPVTIRELQTSIKNLFSTGNFRDIRVDSQRDATGVVLTFALFLNYRVGEIRLTGIGGRDENRAERELTVRPGEVLSLNDVDDSAAAIEEALNRSGFLEATVDPVTTFDRARSIADVQFDINTGPRATIANVIIEGDLRPFTAPQLIEPMKRDAGRDFDVLEAREDAERIQNFLVRRRHRRARVDYLGHEYDETARTVTLRYRVNVGPTVQVAVQGVPQSSVRRWLPFRGRNDVYSEDAVDRAADQIVAGLQGRGHYNAAVETESRLENNVWTTTFIVSPGPRYRLTGVLFTGNSQVEDEDVERIVTVSPRGGFKRALASLFRRPTGVTREQLGDDQDALESFYRLRGFSLAAVAEPIVTTNDTAGTMTVTFPITEGPQTIVTELKVEGNEELAADQLPELQLKVGEPLNPQLAHEDRVALQSEYAERGYVEVQVEPRVVISEDKTQASVSFVIAEGPQVSFGEVAVRGNTYTDRDVVLRRADIEQKTPFTYTRILEAQRELYRLGIFQRVEIQPEQADVTPGERNLVIQVEEGKNLTLTGAVGLRIERGEQDARLDGDATDEPDPPAADATITDDGGSDINERIAIAAAHRNLFGTGRYLGVEAVLSRDEREFFLTYREPFISRWNVPVQLQIFQSDDNTRPDVHIQQRGTSIEATKVALQRTRWSLRYEYKISECIDGGLCALLRAPEDPNAPDVPVEGLDRSLSNIEISSINPTFFWDTRDDIIDPHRGFFTSASVEYAFPFISAEANFLKEFVQGAVYLPISARTVVALSGRLGMIQPLGDTDHDDVPLSERFTAGGENSHRAFRLDRLGELCFTEAGMRIEGCQGTLTRRVDDKTGLATGPILPLGGSGLLLFNAEYRFPVFGPVGGAVFGDIGNTFADSKIRFDDLRYGFGVGVRYLSPVGPLRIDVGYPLDKRYYDDTFVYFISLGYAF
jgi:outer membrane protein insertion porin family